MILRPTTTSSSPRYDTIRSDGRLRRLDRALRLDGPDRQDARPQRAAVAARRLAPVAEKSVGIIVVKLHQRIVTFWAFLK